MSEAQPVAIVCLHCGQPTAAQSLAHKQPDDADAIMEFLWCGECDNGLLVWRELFLTEHPDGSPLMDLGQPIAIWPQRDRDLSAAIPDTLRSVHEEARKCFHATAYSATAAMVRRTLEVLCADQNAQGRSLAAKLADLATRQILDQRLVTWTTSLRVLGNEAVHTADSVDAADARDALELAEAILDYVYVFTAKFLAFEARRAAAATPPTSSTP